MLGSKFLCLMSLLPIFSTLNRTLLFVFPSVAALRPWACTAETAQLLKAGLTT